MLGEQAILNRIKKLEKLNDEINERKEAADKIKAELKQHLSDIDETSCKVGRYTIWNETSERHTVDSARLKEAYEEICKRYNNEVEDFTKVSFVTSFRVTHKQH